MTYFDRPSNIFIRVLIAALVSGCTVGPDYQRPTTDLPAKWSTELPNNQMDGKQNPQVWWQSFNDALLTSLITQARLGNRDLYQAEARIREARASRDLAIANILPSLSMNASASKNQPSNASRFGQVGQFSSAYNQFSHSLDASWEVDLWGKQRRSIESAEAGLDAAEEDLRDVLVSLYAEVAINYIDVRRYQNELIVAKESLKAQQENYDIAYWREQAGLVSRVDVLQAKQSVETTRADIPKYTSLLEQAKHGLAVLLGKQPAELNALLAQSAPIPAASNSIAIGIPADILRQRPDVRRSERELAAQTAQIGVAEAAAYPSFDLSGSIGVEALAAANLYTAAAKAFQLAVSSAWVLFDSGRIRSNVKMQTALQEQALGLYQNTILTALKEVEDSLIAYTQERQRCDALKASVTIGKDALTLAEQQYQAGTADFLTVLESQQSLLTAQNQLIESETEVASNLVTLYKALGGGWNQNEAKPVGTHS
ncbi:efflux transporter outer membrane subunit [Methylosarcina fibrata]|uniref:efflux transporter outer membrane subunit n=1 Tax=Methylosarcina fibrata TaxID=105972 RepID=UPI00039C5570|nr:efflux transporter outer membrane subunit [Methylosarcina fibrata]